MPIKIKQTLPIYFATNRRMSGSRTNPRFGADCHRDGAQFYRVGTATVQKVSKDLDTGYETTKIEVEGERNKNNFQDRGSDKLFHTIRQAINNQSCDVLVYIHGYANTFEGSIARAAPNPRVLRSWPPG